MQREDVRELIEPPYRLIYRVQPEAVEVLSILHGRQELGELLYPYGATQRALHLSALHASGVSPGMPIARPPSCMDVRQPQVSCGCWADH